MNWFPQMTRLLIVFFMIPLIFPHGAYAYIDPGTGSYILQLIIAVFVGAMYAIKIFWKRIIAFVKKLFSSTGGE